MVPALWGRPAWIVRAGLLLALIGSVAWLAFSASAYAEGPPYSVPTEQATEPDPPEGQPVCPAGELETYEGEDDAAGEVRRLRSEVADVCAALSARSDRTRERAWWAVAEALAASEQRQTTNERLTAIADRLETYEGGSEQQVADLVAAVDASGSATKEALWFLAGLLTLGAGLAIYRMVRP